MWAKRRLSSRSSELHSCRPFAAVYGCAARALRSLLYSIGVNNLLT